MTKIDNLAWIIILEKNIGRCDQMLCCSNEKFVPIANGIPMSNFISGLKRKKSLPCDSGLACMAV